ncbi:MAG: DUF2889 domain-containing protein [Candidatus Binatia bacterium]
MPLSATGNPLHSRALSVTLRAAAAPAVAFDGYVLDLRKRGFAPVGGDLQGPGIIHHMRLAGQIDRAAGRITAIEADMPTVAFEATPATRGESCRDQIGRVAGLAGLAIDQSWAPGLSAAIGATRGCSHVLTLAQLIGPTARWALAEDDRLCAGAPPRRAGERLFRRDVTVDGYEPVLGELVFTLQLNDLHFAPAAALAAPMDRFGRQREIVARATLTMQTLELTSLELRERVRDAADFRAAEWIDRSAAAASLVGALLRAGITARILALFTDPQADAPLRDALLQLAPGLILRFAALDIWTLPADESAARQTQAGSRIRAGCGYGSAAARSGPAERSAHAAPVSRGWRPGPPSTKTTSPVVYPTRRRPGEAAAQASSSGSPTRPRAVRGGSVAQLGDPECAALDGAGADGVDADRGAHSRARYGHRPRQRRSTHRARPASADDGEARRRR